MLTCPPLMMQPGETIESRAVPMRSGCSPPAKTNLGGGTCGIDVWMGQSLSYKFKSGVTLTKSILA